VTLAALLALAGCGGGQDAPAPPPRTAPTEIGHLVQLQRAGDPAAAGRIARRLAENGQARAVLVTSDAMRPLLLRGESVIVDPRAYSVRRPPAPGDVVALRPTAAMARACGLARRDPLVLRVEAVAHGRLRARGDDPAATPCDARTWGPAAPGLARVIGRVVAVYEPAERARIV
jgi:hypothetical protein